MPPLAQTALLQIRDQLSRVVGDDRVHARIDQPLPVARSIGGPGNYLKVGRVRLLHLLFGDQVKCGRYDGRFGVARDLDKRPRRPFLERRQTDLRRQPLHRMQGTKIERLKDAARFQLVRPNHVQQHL